MVLVGLLVIVLASTLLVLGANYASTRLAGRPAVAAGPGQAVVQAVPNQAGAAAMPGGGSGRIGEPGGLVVKSTAAQLATPLSASGPPAPTETPDIPAEVLLREVPSGKQTRSLNCEFQTASDLAWYYGQPYTWEEIYQYVGHDVGGNPHKGFVGRSFDDAPGQLYPQGYGVYAEPIALAFAQLGLAAEASYGNPPEWLQAQLAGGRPVMVWATANMTVHPVATWTAADGAVVRGVPGEHTYLAVGYNQDGVWLIDPWDGQRRFFPWEVFLRSWDLLERMALVVIGVPGGAGAP
ncbi:MAG: hypothetical protein CVU38_10095 [Chloroflexi bacterium HGW-Chloroflexi-1]|nr:MAG: hypothetical protein CVU38_10095 [Chloroflexi bacterium HGW-Chloroflexi-1]